MYNESHIRMKGVSGMDDQELDIIEMTDDEGNTILMQVVDYFFYNGDEYVILSDNVEEDVLDAEDVEEINCYVMKVLTSTNENGEEMEEFVPIEDLALEEKLIEIANRKLNEDEEPED